MINLKSILDRYTRTAPSWSIFLLQNWPTIVGSLAVRINLLEVKGEMLVIGVYDPHWMHELYLLSPLLISTINSKLEKPYVKHVRFVLAQKRANLAARGQALLAGNSLPVGSYRTMRPNKRPTARQERLLKEIKDPELAHELERLLAQCK